jgi:hypothetical protein
VSKRRRLTLDEEREMLAEVRNWRHVSEEEYRQFLEERIGTARSDQIQAASAEAEKRIAAFAEEAAFPLVEVESFELASMLVAGVLRCLAASSCEHAVRGDRPLVVVLAARVIACDPCLLRFRGAIAASDQRVVAGHDRLCDLCLEEPEDGFFFPTAVAFGPAKVCADVCGSCQRRAMAAGGPAA